MLISTLQLFEAFSMREKKKIPALPLASGFEIRGSRYENEISPYFKR